MWLRFYGGPYAGYRDVTPVPIISFPEKNSESFDLSMEFDTKGTMKRHKYEYRKTLLSGNPLKDPDQIPVKLWSNIDGATALYEDAYHYIEDQ